MSSFKDEIIGKFIDMEIGKEMSLPTLYALEAIFYLRLQLAQVGREEKEPIYESLCCERFEQISKTLILKYESAETLDDKIGILNHLQNISVTMDHGDNYFVADRRQELMSYPNLKFAQKYWLDNLLNFNYNNIKGDIESLVAKAESAFDMSILFNVDSLGTSTQYSAVMDQYEAIFSKAVTKDNISEIANLLTVVAYCNSNPNRRQRIKDLTAKFIIGSSLAVNLPLPVIRVNSIAAEIYSRIDKITGKYDILSA